MRVAIFASGNGTNFEVLAKHFQSGDIPGELSLLFCNHPDAPVMKRAQRLGIPAESFTVKSCGGKEEYEKQLLQLLKKYSIERAFNDQRKQTGVTVHYIDAGLDSGPIIAQRHVPILPSDTVETLEERVHETEHQLYPEAVKQVLTELEKEN